MTMIHQGAGRRLAARVPGSVLEFAKRLSSSTTRPEKVQTFRIGIIYKAKSLKFSHWLSKKRVASSCGLQQR